MLDKDTVYKYVGQIFGQDEDPQPMTGDEIEFALEDQCGLDLEEAFSGDWFTRDGVICYRWETGEVEQVFEIVS